MSMTAAWSHPSCWSSFVPRARIPALATSCAGLATPGPVDSWSWPIHRLMPMAPPTRTAIARALPPAARASRRMLDESTG